LRILVADQDAEHRATLVQYIQGLGHTTQEALTEREVIDQCRTKCPDLVFLDLKLSGVSGINITRQIRQLGGHAVWVPLVLMSPSFTDADIQAGIEAGADDFYTKPIPPLKVLAKIQSAVRHQNLKEEVYALAHNLVVANRALESVVTQDVLTGVGNSNSFDDALEREWFEAKNKNLPLALVMTNLDYFQAFNQSYGAPKGDTVIKQVAATLRQAVPEGSFVARMAGETFAILLPKTPRDMAETIAEQLRQTIDGLKIPHVSSGCSDHLTASFGVAVQEPGHYTSPWDLKESADYGLYQAKHYGRNRVYLIPIAETKVS